MTRDELAAELLRVLHSQREVDAQLAIRDRIEVRLAQLEYMHQDIARLRRECPHHVKNPAGFCQACSFRENPLG